MSDNYLENCTHCLRLKNKDGGIDILPYSKWHPLVRVRPIRPETDEPSEPRIIRQNYVRSDFL